MKRPGHCTLCDEPVREIVKKHTKGKKKGEPVQLGGWLDNAWRVSFLLSDNSIADMTFCGECVESTKNLYSEIWERVKERFLWEEEVLEVQRTPVQQAAVEKTLNHILEQSIEKEVGRRMWKYS